MDTSNNTDINIQKYKGFDSFYNVFDELRWETLNEGRAYEKTLFEDSTSRYLSRNPNTVYFFPYLNAMMSYLINSVKYLRNFNNFGVRKDYKRIN